ncbi:ABC transporter ATP-binding protein (plasmid) [Entomospira entomophila]|uniref:ABC transporter ATP-binding protein n=1 Tax=Entomospira entomophila TaxID=2719988 RepID=A0A968KS31_9SPIO|nr:ABC transporter ATP-binding protein [Entomospira entomophilus]NIZ41324.1 ABC transporter ATP-binding protein [Entomospira entomophilus]WDI36264.1 ABC transporter ATP-binding protein [Entomospira entomophilus]
MIEICNVTFSRSRKCIIRDLTLQLSNQEITAILGVNGSGKSTLMKLILGLYTPDSGTIFYHQQQLSTISLKKRSQYVAYVTQHDRVQSHLSTMEYILMGAYPRLQFLQRPGCLEQQKVRALLERLSIQHLASKQLSQLSGGEMQLVHFARAMMQETPFLILDEPSSALDYQKQHEMMCYLSQILTKEQVGALISLHDPNLAIRVANRIVILHEGLIIADVHQKQPDFIDCILQGLNTIFHHKIALVPSSHGYLFTWIR